MSYDAYECDCALGFDGADCDGYVSSCGSSPCLNGGTCATGAAWAYSCACDANFRGENCDLCDPGWEGAGCADEIDECHSDPCFNGATCYDAFNSYRCHCMAGYDAYRCDRNIDECASTPCGGHGVCHDKVAGYGCACLAGWVGENCAEQVLVCDAADDDCDPAAACWYNVLFGGAREAVCGCGFGYAAGWGGSCVDPDACASAPCANGVCAQTAAGGVLRVTSASTGDGSAVVLEAGACDGAAWAGTAAACLESKGTCAGADPDVPGTTTKALCDGAATAAGTFSTTAAHVATGAQALALFGGARRLN